VSLSRFLGDAELQVGGYTLRTTSLENETKDVIPDVGMVWEWVPHLCKGMVLSVRLGWSVHPMGFSVLISNMEELDLLDLHFPSLNLSSFLTFDPIVFMCQTDQSIVIFLLFLLSMFC
jgi:hypothetical protein